MSVHRLGNAARWSACLSLAVGIHAAGALALLARLHHTADRFSGAPAILVDFAPTPAAPAITPAGLPPGPPKQQVQPESQAKPEPAPETPVEKAEAEPEVKASSASIEMPVEPTPAQTTDVLPPPKPAQAREHRKPKHREASLASAPSPSVHHAPRAAAPAPGPSARDPDALPNWKSSLLARLERYKRYPSEARARGEQGVVQLAFSVDRSGGVHHVRIARSSGSTLLDRATMQLIERAQPLPPPPAGVAGSGIAIVVPIRYHIH